MIDMVSSALDKSVDLINDEPVVSFSNVKFSWDTSDDFELHIPALEIHRGEKLLLIGPSGSGKSTLLSLLCGIVTPQSGKVRILNQDMNELSGRGRDRFRADHFGIIFQMFNLLPYGSVIDNVILPLNFAKTRASRVERHAARAAGEAGEFVENAQQTEARRLLSRLGLDASIQNRTTTASLSVGQQQRVAAARALIGRPEIIVADEPTSSLDRNRQLAFLDLLFEEVAQSASTLIMVSHDETLGSKFDRVLDLNDVLSGSSSTQIKGASQKLDSVRGGDT